MSNFESKLSSLIKQWRECLDATESYSIVAEIHSLTKGATVTSDSLTSEQYRETLQWIEKNYSKAPPITNNNQLTPDCDRTPKTPL